MFLLGGGQINPSIPYLTIDSRCSCPFLNRVNCSFGICIFASNANKNVYISGVFYVTPLVLSVPKANANVTFSEFLHFSFRLKKMSNLALNIYKESLKCCVNVIHYNFYFKGN